MWPPFAFDIGRYFWYFPATIAQWGHGMHKDTRPMTTPTNRKYHQSLLASIAATTVDLQKQVPGAPYGALLLAKHAHNTHVPAEHRKDAITAFEAMRDAITEADRKSPIDNVAEVLAQVDQTVESIELQVTEQNGTGGQHVEPAAAAATIEQAGTEQRTD